MNTLDIILIAILIADIARGAKIGFVTQFFSFAGSWGGILLGALIAPFTARYGETPLAKLIIVVLTILLVASILTIIGEKIAHRGRKLVHRYKAHRFNAGLGAAFGAILVILSTWILSAMLQGAPIPALSQEIQGSKVVRQINRILPPAPPIVARIQRLIDLNGFPQVFVGPEPTPSTPADAATEAEVANAVRAARASTVKITGVGCGGQVFGSGFVADSGIVITNAHVIAGITRPIVVDGNGTHRATTIYFDPNLDIAVLRTSGLAGAPLRIQSATVANGTHAIALGYPGGGRFTASPGSVMRHYFATGRNIYDAGLTSRQIYEVSADIEQGNSGGPLVLPDGTVIGVIFARSSTVEDVGYSLMTPAVLRDLQRAKAANRPVGTGTCAAE